MVCNSQVLVPNLKFSTLNNETRSFIFEFGILHSCKLSVALCFVLSTFPLLWGWLTCTGRNPPTHTHTHVLSCNFVAVSCCAVLFMHPPGESQPCITPSTPVLSFCLKRPEHVMWHWSLLFYPYSAVLHLFCSNHSFCPRLFLSLWL